MVIIYLDVLCFIFEVLILLGDCYGFFVYFGFDGDVVLVNEIVCQVCEM